MDANEILNVNQVKEILDSEPEAEFSLQPVKVQFTDGPGYMVAGYHIHRGHLPRMIKVRGNQIWQYVGKP
jgi:hypothetical protein